MNFIDATKGYFVNWLDFKTRSSRSEFWWGNLGAMIVGLLIGLVFGLVFGILAVMLDWPLETLDLAILPVQIYLYIAG